MRNKVFQPTPEMNELLRKSGSLNKSESLAATAELAKALELPLRQGVLTGDILDGIFEVIQMAPGATTEWPLDFLSPGTESDFVAYTIPNHGRIPERHVEGDYVMIPTYETGAAIDWLLKYARDARWDIVSRAMEVLQASFVKKFNTDGFAVLFGAATDRNIVVFDSDAAAGQFTKRLVSLMKIVFRRNGGGNSTSLNRRRLTDLYMSPEAIEDIRNWNVDEVDDVTRRELITSEGGLLTRIFQVNLHELDELGESQEYQTFYTSELGGTFPTGDVELVLGLDLSRNDSFVMPVREAVQIFEDDNLHRERRAGLYGFQDSGFSCLDNRNVLLGSF